MKQKQKIQDKLRTQLEKSLARKLGPDSITVAQDISRWYPTNCPPIDLLSSGKIGEGLPSGRAIELFGEESVGKTTFGLRCLAEMQRLGGLALIIDTEKTFQRKRGKSLGLNVEELTVLSEHFLEPILDGIIDILSNMEGESTPMLIFWDTIAGTPTRREMGSDVGESAIGTHARYMSEGLRRICPLLPSTNVTLLACNQLKKGAITDRYALERDQDATLGGSALRYHAESRIKLQMGRKLLKTRDATGGFEVRCSCVKNKNLPSQTRVRLIFASDIGGMFDNALSCLSTLRLWNAMPKETIRIGTKKKLSLEQWRKSYNQDEAFREEVHQMMKKTYDELYLEEEV